VSPPCSLPISMGGQIKAVGAARPRRTRASTWFPALANEFQVRTCRRAVELVLESIFVCETIEVDRRRIIRGGRHGQTACRSRSAPSRYLLWKRRSRSSEHVESYHPDQRRTKRMVSSAGLRPPRSARVQTSDYSRSPCNSNLANRSKVPYEPEKFRYAPAKSRF